MIYSIISIELMYNLLFLFDFKYSLRPGYNAEYGRVLVTLGLHNTSSPDPQHTITIGKDGPLTIFIHENYNEDTLENDIALVIFEREIFLTDYVRPICLPKNLDEIQKNNQNGTLHDASLSIQSKTVHIAGDIFKNRTCQLVLLYFNIYAILT